MMLRFNWIAKKITQGSATGSVGMGVGLLIEGAEDMEKAQICHWLTKNLRTANGLLKKNIGRLSIMSY